MVVKIKTVLQKYLENLRENSFKSFKRHLNNYSVSKEYRNIPWGTLEKADAQYVTDLIIQFYTIEYGPILVIDVLNDIDERQASLDLQEELGKAPFKVEQTPWKGIQGKEYTANKFSKRKRAREKKENQPESLCMELRCSEEPVGEDGTLATSYGTVKETSHAPKTALPNSEQQGNRMPLTNCKSNTANNNGERPIQPELYEPHVYQMPQPSLQEIWEEAPIVNKPLKRKIRHNVDHTVQPFPTMSSVTSVRTLPELPKMNNTASTDPTRNYSPKSIPPRGKPRPDMMLVDLTLSNVEVMLQNHNGKAHLYARYLFEHFVPWDIYTTWVKNTNFDGYAGKHAIPKNLSDAILQRVRKEFQLTRTDRKNIRKTINGLLSTVRSTGWKPLI